MNKIIRLLKPLLVAGIISLTGCASIKNALMEKIIDDSGVKNTNEYKTYVELNDSGKLTDDGKYDFEKNELVENAIYGNGSVHVSFARNTYINVTFFSDANHTNIIDECLINPGEKLYYSYLVNNPNSNYYDLEGFRVQAIEKEGDEIKRSVISFVERNDQNILLLPSSISNNNVVIEPIGKYSNKIIHLSDSLYSNSDDRDDLNGEWIINGESFKNNVAEIDASIDAKIEYKYDTSNYFVTDTEPQYYSNNTKKGVVAFEIHNAEDNIDSYSVQLHKLINVSFSGNVKKGLKEILVNDAPVEMINNQIRGLKWDDEILLLLEEGYYADSSDLNAKNGMNNNEMVFTITQDANDSYSIIISNSIDKYEPISLQNGVLSVVYSESKEELKEGPVDGNSNVIVTISPNPGYYIEGKNVKDNIYSKQMKFSEFKANILEILKAYEIKKYITINPIEKGEYGISIYKVNGKEQEGTISNLKEGQKITIEYMLEDHDYTIVHPSNLPFNIDGWFRDTFSNDKISIDLEVTKSMDNQSIQGENYVVLKRKGE